MITPQQKQHFEKQGYVAIEGLLDENSLDGIRSDYETLLERVAVNAARAGSLPRDYARLPFGERISAVLRAASVNLYRHFDIALPNEPISENTPMNTSRAVFDMVTHPRILDVMEGLLGPEILASPIQHVRIKPPERVGLRSSQGTLVSRTGWHQDQGVAREEADDTDLITVWLAITDATEQNGCLQVVPGSHLQGLAIHCPTGVAVNIPDGALGGEPISVPLQAGGALLMHRRTKHASLPNYSDGIRWSFDLRYQPIGQPTGRAELPGIVARSRVLPTTTYAEWIDAWAAARRALAGVERGRVHRWTGDDPVCA